MNNLNLNAMQGNICKDANFHNGDAYFTIANNKSYRDAKSPTGWTQKTAFVPCRVNGKLAAVLAPKLKKGHSVTVTGSLSTYQGSQKVFVERGGELKQIPDNQFIIDIDSIDIEERSASEADAANSQQSEDQAPAGMS